jgi:hypothetical protein
VLLFVFIFLVVGVILGTRAFLRRAAAAVKINLFGRRGLLIRPRLSGVGLQSLGGARGRRGQRLRLRVPVRAVDVYSRTGFQS